MVSVGCVHYCVIMNYYHVPSCVTMTPLCCSSSFGWKQVRLHFPLVSRMTNKDRRHPHPCDEKVELKEWEVHLARKRAKLTVLLTASLISCILTKVIQNYPLFSWQTGKSTETQIFPWLFLNVGSPLGIAFDNL